MLVFQSSVVLEAKLVPDIHFVECFTFRLKEIR